MRRLLAIDDAPKSDLAIEELLGLNIPEKSKLRVVTATELPVIITTPVFNPSMKRAGLVLESIRNRAKPCVKNVGWNDLGEPERVLKSMNILGIEPQRAKTAA